MRRIQRDWLSDVFTQANLAQDFVCLSLTSHFSVWAVPSRHKSVAIMKALTFSLVCLCLALANPNIQISLTEQTLNTALLTAYAFGLTSAHFYIGDFNYTMKTDLGDLDLRLTDINITSVSLNYVGSLFALQDPDLITYNIEDLEVNVTLGYDIKFGLIHLSPGKATAVVSNTNATVTVALSELKGKPQIAFESASLVLGDILIETQLPKEFNDMLNSEVKKQVANLSKSLPNLLAANEPKINALLGSLDLVIKCPVEPLAIDLSLYSSPAVNDSTLVVGLSGTVLAGGQAIPGPAAVPMEVNAVVTEGLQAGLSDYVVNAVLQPVWSMVNLNVTELPSPLGNLTTTTLALVVPQLKWKYGNAPVLLNVYTTPTSYINYWTNAGNINLNGSASVDFWVYSQSNWAKALTLAMDFSVQATAHITNNVASATIKTVKLVKVAQSNSQIGTVNTALLINLINSLAGAMVIELNPKLQNYAINLPDGAGYFVNTDDVKIASGYIIAGVDV